MSGFESTSFSTKPAPIKTLPCPWEGCDRMFTCKHNVNEHIMEQHTKERPSKCTICEQNGKEKDFTRPASLYRHLRDVHGVEVDTGRQRPTRRTVGPRRDPIPAAEIRGTDRRTVGRPAVRRGQKLPAQEQAGGTPRMMSTHQQPRPMDFLTQPAPGRLQANAHQKADAAPDMSASPCDICGMPISSFVGRQAHMQFSHGINPTIAPFDATYAATPQGIQSRAGSTQRFTPLSPPAPARPGAYRFRNDDLPPTPAASDSITTPRPDPMLEHTPFPQQPTPEDFMAPSNDGFANVDNDQRAIGEYPGSEELLAGFPDGDHFDFSELD